MAIYILLVWNDGKREGPGRAIGAYSTSENAERYAQQCAYTEYTVLRTHLDS